MEATKAVTSDPQNAPVMATWFRLRRGFINELIKLFARPRTHIGFAVFILFEILILSLLRLPRPQAAFRRLLEDNGYLFNTYFTGPTLAVAMIAAAVFFLGALYLALIAGDIVAKEVEDGTLRMILNRPVSRLQLLLVKWASVLIYTFVLLAFLGVSSVVIGTVFQGWGGLFVYAPAQGVFAILPPGQGLLRISGAILLLALSLCTVSSIAFCISCMPVKPAAATILTLSLVFADFVLQNLPYFSDYQHYFLSYHMGQWVRFFETPIPWAALGKALIPLWAVNFSCLVIAAAVFCQRDFKN